MVLAGCTPTMAPTPTVSEPDPWSERGPVTIALPDDQSSAAAWRSAVVGWNAAHPDEPVTIIDLPAATTERHSELADSLRAGSGEFTVAALDPAWTVEFATNGWLTPLPETRFPTTALEPSAVASGRWDDALYAYPVAVDTGLLYYRADLLRSAGVAVPTTWDELQDACARVLPSHPGLACYAGQYSGEGLTVNLAEAIASAGGEIVTPAGVAAVDSSAALAGVSWLTDWVSAGRIPDAALTWDETGARDAFAAGGLLFVRDWATAWQPLTQAVPGTAVTTIPGRSGAGIAVLGGRSLAITANARNKGTAARFVAYLVSNDLQRRFTRAGAFAPALTSLYADEDLAGDAGFVPVVATSLGTATTRPVTEHYTEVSRAIQEAGEQALQGTATPQQVLGTLQARLTELLQ